MLVNIDKGDKVKIVSIDFVGNTKISDKKLRKAMKDTKEKLIRVLKPSKYIKDKYKSDLEKHLTKKKDLEMLESYLILVYY
jgi:outer membrane protein insertion porin family